MTKTCQMLNVRQDLLAASSCNSLELTGRTAPMGGGGGGGAALAPAGVKTSNSLGGDVPLVSLSVCRKYNGTGHLIANNNPLFP